MIFKISSSKIKVEMHLLLFLIIALKLSYSKAVTGIDVSSPVSFSQFQCMKNSGYSLAIVRGYCPNGAIDPNAKATLENAKSAGINHDAYHFPCVGEVSPQDQVNAIVNYWGTCPEFIGLT